VIQRAVLERLPALGLSPRARVLDAPCDGTAALTHAVREWGFDAVGGDIDPEAVADLGKAFAKMNLDTPLPPDGPVLRRGIFCLMLIAKKV